MNLTFYLTKFNDSQSTGENIPLWLLLIAGIFFLICGVLSIIKYFRISKEQETDILSSKINFDKNKYNKDNKVHWWQSARKPFFLIMGICFLLLSLVFLIITPLHK